MRLRRDWGKVPEEAVSEAKGLHTENSYEIMSPKDALNELSFYTLSHPDPTYFIHQLCVDAFHAQNADANTKPIQLVFALLGLHLFLERGYSGREVQLAHMKLARNKKSWPLISLPVQRGTITVFSVLRSESGQEKDRMIKDWCTSVWSAYHESHTIIVTLANEELRSGSGVTLLNHSSN